MHHLRPAESLDRLDAHKERLSPEQAQAFFEALSWTLATEAERLSRSICVDDCPVACVSRCVEQAEWEELDVLLLEPADMEALGLAEEARQTLQNFRAMWHTLSGFLPGN